MGISREQALDCFRSDDLVGIGMEADAVRRRLHPEGVVSYVLECAVTTPVMDPDRLCNEIAAAVDMGCTGVRILDDVFAGVDSSTKLDRIEESLRCIRRRLSSVWVEGFSAAEILALAATSKLGLHETVLRLQAAGLDAISGDSLAIGLEDWLTVHRTAHTLGMQTTASMIFGAGETPEQRVDFLYAVRQLQQEAGGFAAFVPIAADAPGGRDLDGVTAVERLKTLAIARMFLDDIDNVQLSPAGQGLKVLQMGLRFGANDIGEVSVTAASGMAEEDVRRVIRDAGFMPVQREMGYRAMLLS